MVGCVRRMRSLGLSISVAVASPLVLFHALHAHAAPEQDPAAWGSNHVGQPVPEYEDGNTCLFCHRTSIGPNWQTDKHATTIRALAEESNAEQLKQKASGAEFEFGRDSKLRFLKPTGAYGTFSLLDASWSPKNKEWSGEERWDAAKFGAECAGCHASGVDSVEKTFQMPSLDCHTCHGLAVPEHAEDGTLMLLSKKGKTPAEVEVSICGSCHLRGGKSKSTGLPFPNNFVPGDNLFKDFDLDLSDERISKESPSDAHIFRVARDVVFFGLNDVSCTTCHDVHGESEVKHVSMPRRAICFVCHTQSEPLTTMPTEKRQDLTCEY